MALANTICTVYLIDYLFIYHIFSFVFTVYQFYFLFGNVTADSIEFLSVAALSLSCTVDDSDIVVSYDESWATASRLAAFSVFLLFYLYILCLAMWR